MKRAILLATAAAAMLGLANPASAAPYLFTLTGDYSASWILDSTPVTSSPFDWKFTVAGVTGNFSGLAGTSVVIDFYADSFLGGFTISDETSHAVLADGYDVALFSGTTSAPTFLTGTFSLTNNHGVNPFTLVIGAAPAVPEPATWALMIGGFALAGAAMRRAKVRVAYA